jgi:glycosyltransferase involved in cell wall biosynthesis
MDLVLFLFTEKWWDFERDGARGRTAILTDRLSRHPAVRRVLVVDAPTGPGGRGPAPDAEKVTGLPWLRRSASGVFVLDQRRILPRDRHHPTAFAVNAAVHDVALVARVRRAVAVLGMRSPAVWLAGPLAVTHAAALGPGFGPIVYDAVDDWAVHPAYAAMRPALLSGYRGVLEQADLVFAVTRALARRFDGGRPRLAVLPNAADPIPRGPVPPDVAYATRPRIGYAGVIDERVDVSLLAELARRMPDAEFVLLGPVLGDAARQLLGLGNVRMLGARPASQVGAYLRAMDAAVMPHRITPLTRTMDPMKLWEYLAAGLPVVSSDIPGLVHPEDLVARAGGVDEWEARLRRILSGARPDRAVLERYVAANTWDARAADAVAVIRALPPRRPVLVPVRAEARA